MARHLATILPSKEAIKDTATKVHLEEDITLQGTWDRLVDLEVLILRVPEVRPVQVVHPGDQEAIPRMTLAMDRRLAREGPLSLELPHHKMLERQVDKHDSTIYSSILDRSSLVS